MENSGKWDWKIRKTTAIPHVFRQEKEADHGQAAHDQNPRLQTAHLVLRPLETRDAPGFLAMRTDKTVTAQMNLPVMAELLQAEKYVKTRIKMAAEGDCLFWAAEWKTTEKFAGSLPPQPPEPEPANSAPASKPKPCAWCAM